MKFEIGDMVIYQPCRVVNKCFESLIGKKAKIVKNNSAVGINIMFEHESFIRYLSCDNFQLVSKAKAHNHPLTTIFK